MPGTGAIRQVVLFLLLAASACEKRLDPPEVEFAGCNQVFVGPVCAFSRERKLRLWLRAEDPKAVEISADDAGLAAPFEAVDGGWRFSIEVPSGADHLQVEVPGHRAWQLPLAEARLYERIERARVLKDSDESKAIALEAAKSADPAERAQALGMLGRLLLGEAAIDRAVTALEQAVNLHRQGGCVSWEIEDGMALVYVLISQTRDFGRARAVLDQFEPDEHPDPRARFLIPYFRGTLAVEAGDLSAALLSLDDAQHAAQRLDVVETAISAAQMRAVALTALGQYEDALSMLIEAQKSACDLDDPCERADLEHNIGWTGLLAAESGKVSGGLSLQRVQQSLERASALHQTECTRRSSAGSILIDLALVALHQGDLDQAHQRLHQAQELLPSTEPRLALWQLDIAGRLALAGGQTEDALRLFERLAALGRDVEAPDAQWRAALGRARALRARGEVNAALTSYEASEKLIEAAARRVTLGDGRDTFLGAQARGTAEHVELLIDLGRTKQASLVARQARRRALLSAARPGRVASLSASERTVWEQQIGQYRRLRAEIEQATRGNWGLAVAARAQQAADMERKRAELAQALDSAFAVLDGKRLAESTLNPPEPGELLLFYYPLADAVLAFGETATRTVVRRVDLERDTHPSELLAELLLGPFGEQISAADRIRVVGAGVGSAVDVHALRWQGRPLIEARAVAYSLDLPRVSENTGDVSANFPGRVGAGHAHRNGAVIVADPVGDLRGARREAGVVRSALEARGFAPVQRLSGSMAVSATVRSAMAVREVAHFAGHGEYVPTSGLDSALALADGGRLRVADVLSLPHVPRVVFLAGCDTARTRTATPVQGLGLAHAFLLAGANAVVAATRPVRDDMGAALSRSFYENLDGLDAWAAANALREAQLSLMLQQPDADWAAYRAMIQ